MEQYAWLDNKSNGLDVAKSELTPSLLCFNATRVFLRPFDTPNAQLKAAYSPNEERRWGLPNLEKYEPSLKVEQQRSLIRGLSLAGEGPGEA
eukprot:scaffold180191_cov20-Prasinocladus_malaysianus.AAC.2